MALKLETRRLLVIWWAFVWRAMLAGAIAGFVVGVIAGAVLAILGQAQLIQPVCTGLGWIVGVAGSFWAMGACLGKTYRDFKIQIIPLEAVFD